MSSGISGVEFSFLVTVQIDFGKVQYYGELH